MSKSASGVSLEENSNLSQPSLDSNTQGMVDKEAMAYWEINDKYISAVYLDKLHSKVYKLKTHRW